MLNKLIDLGNGEFVHPDLIERISTLHGGKGVAIYTKDKEDSLTVNATEWARIKPLLVAADADPLPADVMDATITLYQLLDGNEDRDLWTDVQSTDAVLKAARSLCFGLIRHYAPISRKREEA